MTLPVLTPLMSRRTSAPLLSMSAVRKTFGKGLSRHAGGRVVLRCIDLELHAGEIIGVCGEESSGKTALLQCAAGLLSHDGGEIRWFGESVGRGGPVKGVEFVPAVSEYYPFLTVRDVLEFRASRAATNVQRCETMVEEAMLWLGLLRLDKSPVMNLSRPEVKRLAVAEALVVTPRALLVDASASDSVSWTTPEMLRTLRDFAARGGAVMIASRDLPVLERIASRTVSIADGMVTPAPRIEAFSMPRFVAERLH